MKQTQFKYNTIKVFKKSILIWVILLFQIGTSLFLIYKNSDNTTDALIAANISFSLITIPGILLHLNHLFKTRNTTFTLRYETISIENKRMTITLNSPEINQIILHEGSINTKLPWWDYSWYEFIDLNGKSIKVSCYLLEISDLWQDNLSRRINSKNIKHKRSILPLMK